MWCTRRNGTQMISLSAIVSNLLRKMMLIRMTHSDLGHRFLSYTTHGPCVLDHFVVQRQHTYSALRRLLR